MLRDTTQIILKKLMKHTKYCQINKKENNTTIHINNFFNSMIVILTHLKYLWIFKNSLILMICLRILI